ncbi:MAG: tRNA pseudouridine(38-40) synthase TruA [Bdellovibrionales bacterium]|nr:tRNA pseudouridine(38-40) synthase TruA [Bdellovibrionales bacterium]
MPNIKLILEYNGQNFHGWQVQPEVRTIQGELHRVLEMCLGQKVRGLTASGRTDAGVHAAAQVVNFHVDALPDFGKLVRSVSSILKNEVAIKDACIVSDSFHAMRDAVRKQYSYHIYYRPHPPVLDYGRVWHISGALDVERMATEAKLLIGTHDFTTFQGSGCGARSTIKTIYESELLVHPPYLTYRVVGSGFLKQMVRNIVGTLVALGRDRYGETNIEEMLEWKDRRKAAETAQPYGLCLDWVEYSEHTS